MPSRSVFGRIRQRAVLCAVAIAATGCVASVQGNGATAPHHANDERFDATDGPMVTDRPDHSDSPAVVPRGRVQLEAGETLGRDGDVPYVKIGESLLRLGVRRGIELRVAANSFAMHRMAQGIASGIEDAAIGTKVALVPASNGVVPQLAAILTATVPTGALGMSAQRWLPEAKLAAAWELPARLDVASTVSLSRVRGATAVVPRLGASTTLGVEWTDQLWAYAEFYTLRDGTTFSVRRDFTDAGLALLIAENVQVDVRLGVGLRSNRRDYFTGLGVSRRW